MCGVDFDIRNYLNLSQAAKKLGVSRSTVWRWVWEDKIKGIKIGSRIFVQKDEIMKMITGID